MTEETSQTEAEGSVRSAEPVRHAKSAATTPSWTPITTRGQKYVAPAGRHSQQTHRLAQDRAAAGGHESEKELHAHDRNLLETELKRRADLRIKQQANSKK